MKLVDVTPIFVKYDMPVNDISILPPKTQESDSIFAFDESPSTYYRSSLSPTFPDYIGLSFPERKIIKKYSLSFLREYRNIRSWELQASNNLFETYDVLHSVTDHNVVDDQVEVFELPPTNKSYQYYRIAALSCYGSTWGLNNLKFYEAIYDEYALIKNESKYLKYNFSTSKWETITLNHPSEEDFKRGNRVKELGQISESAWQILYGLVEIHYFTENINTSEAAFEFKMNPFTLREEIDNRPLKIKKYVTNLKQADSKITLETKPHDFYDIMGNSSEVLFYSDETFSTPPTLEVTANYSPFDEIKDDFDIVTWTDDLSTINNNLTVNALPKGIFTYTTNSIQLYGDLKKIMPFEDSAINSKGLTRYLISKDNGMSWLSYKRGNFINVDISNRESIVNNGLSYEDVLKLDGATLSRLKAKEIKLGFYLEESDRKNEISSIDSATVTVLSPNQSTKVSKASLYILNTSSTINVSFSGNTLKGSLDDADRTRVQYRVILNGAPYFPADGQFTPLAPSPLDIRFKIGSENVIIGQENKLKIEFQDYWGQTDYWETTFIGQYDGLVFLDEKGEYFSSNIGEVIKHLDFGVIVAGQTTLEKKVTLKNNYGSELKNILIDVDKSKLPSGISIQFGTNLTSFEALDHLFITSPLKNGESLDFFLRIATKLGLTAPISNGSFDITVKAEEV